MEHGVRGEEHTPIPLAMFRLATSKRQGITAEERKVRIQPLYSNQQTQLHAKGNAITILLALATTLSVPEGLELDTMIGV